MHGWHFPQTSASDFRKNYPKPRNAGTDRCKTAPHHQPSKLAAQSFYIFQSTSVSPPQYRRCDEGFKREEGQENQARADVHRARGNHEHSWTFASLGMLRFTGQPET
jgi:hypothetical protein